MAAGWARHLSGGRVEVYSGGSDPADEINPSATAVMAEAGIDITARMPQRWTTDVISEAKIVVTMGCGDTCPVFPGVAYEDWPLPDPAGLPTGQVRQIRDLIRDRVVDLLDRLGIEAHSRADGAGG